MLTPLQFQQRADVRFADNEFQNITEKSFRELAADIAQTFVAQAVANVPDYEPGRNYAPGFIIRHDFGGAKPVFLAALAPGGPLPAPTSAAGDASWELSLSPATGQALSQVGTVDALRQVQGDWEPNRLYILINRLDAQGDPLPDVYVRALSSNELEPVGYTIDALGTPPAPVSYDLATDTATPPSGEPPITILNSNQLYTYDTLAAAAASNRAEYSALTITKPVPASVASFSTVASLNGNGNTLAGLSNTKRFSISVSNASNTVFVLANVTASEAYNSQFTACTINGRLINCLLKHGNTFDGEVSLEGSTVVPVDFFKAYTKNADGTYTTPEGGTITDRRASSGDARLQLVSDQGLRVAALAVESSDVAISDVRLFDMADDLRFQVNKRVNGNWQPGAQQPLVDLNTTLASLTPGELAAGVELELETLPKGTITSQFMALLTLRGLPGFSQLRGTRPARRVFNPNSSPEPQVGFAFNDGSTQNQCFSFPTPALSSACVAFWFKRNAQPGAGNEYWMLSARPANSSVYVAVDGANGGVAYYVETVQRNNSLLGAPAGQWVRVVANLPALQAGTISLFSGQPGSGAGPAQVEIYDVRFYSRPFTLSEIADRTAAPADSLLARFTFPPNLDPTQPVPDESGHNNNGTLYNF